MSRIQKFLLGIFLTCYSLSSFALDLSRERDVREYIETISQRYNFDEAQLTSWFNQISFEKSTLRKLRAQARPTQPSIPTPFYIYRDKLITPKRVHAGVAFWRQHAQALAIAQQRYGVPAEIIIGILGIETTYGENTGHYSAFRGLTTLAFNHPTRRAYFTSELTNFLLLSRAQGWNPLAIRSSFDGGLGLAQFMPSSYREYAVNAQGERDANVDLWRSGDAIASIGNYLRAKGWQPNQPIAIPAKVLNNDYRRLHDPDGKLKFTIAELQQNYGLAPNKAMPPDTKVGVIYLQDRHNREAWITLKNFSVVRAYNGRINYVMTAYELGRVIAAKS